MPHVFSILPQSSLFFNPTATFAAKSEKCYNKWAEIPKIHQLL